MGGSDASVEPSGDGAVVRVTSGVGHVLGGIAPGPIPCRRSSRPASRVAGRRLRASVGGQLLEFEEVAQAGHFPTAPNDFFVTSTALLRSAARIPEAGLSLGEVWAMGEDPRPALERAGSSLIDRERSADRGVPGGCAEPGGRPDGATAVGALGLVTIVAVGLSLGQRRRAFEFASLRAIGVEATTARSSCSSRSCSSASPRGWAGPATWRGCSRTWGGASARRSRLPCS